MARQHTREALVVQRRPPFPRLAEVAEGTEVEITAEDGSWHRCQEEKEEKEEIHVRVKGERRERKQRRKRVKVVKEEKEAKAG